MSQHTTAIKPVRIPALAAISAKLEAMLDAARPFGVAEDVRDVRLALASLALACQSTLDELAAIGGKATTADLAAVGLMPISGGAPAADDDDYFASLEAPDDYEAPAEEWPSWTDSDRWDLTPHHTGALPLSVLAATAPEPVADEYDAWLDSLAASNAWTAEDQMVTHGCC